MTPVLARRVYNYDAAKWPVLGFSKRGDLERVRRLVGEQGWVLQISTRGKKDPAFNAHRGQVLALTRIGTQEVATGDYVEPTLWKASLNEAGVPRWPYALPYVEARRVIEALDESLIIPRLQGSAFGMVMGQSGVLLNDEERDRALSLGTRDEPVGSEVWAVTGSDDPAEIEFTTAAIRNKMRAARVAWKPAGNARPMSRVGTRVMISRDPAVRAWVLEHAQGNCEFCRKPAPFRNTYGEAFLEVHHVKRLADGGPDVLSNTVALCPNCHREAHLGCRPAEWAAQMLSKVPRLVAA